jgi:peptidoglycan/xylan/chitin deacetylase (PgdA/CDA1 family)
MSVPARIVVFTGDLTYSVLKGIVESYRALPGSSWLVVHHCPTRRVGKLLRSQLRQLRRHGWRWLPHQFASVTRTIGRNGAHPRPDAPGGEYTLPLVQSLANLRFLRVSDLHSDSTLETVRAFSPSLGLSLAAPILRESVFAIPVLGTLNLHQGRLPDYRGMPPAFWELWNGADSVGCTVHLVDAGLDTGDVVAETSVRREPFSTLRGLQLRLDEAGVELVKSSVERVVAGAARFAPQAPGGRTYRKPTLRQVAALKRGLRPKPASPASLPRRLLKETCLSTAVTAWRLGGRRLAPPRITVLLYHRVTDDVRDNLTVGIEQFDRQMQLLETLDVMTISEVIGARTIRPSARPKVCVTFDDGYLDNYENAVPILLRHRIPAAFFVATGIVGTDKQFAHDRRRGNAPIPMMTWDQLRRMRDQGFTIGSHSVSHIDCASEHEDVVKAELSTSLADLKRELGSSEVIFAYPYGSRDNMTPARLELVKQAGYVACLSAYGTVNVERVDPFDVQRTGIHWEFSDAAFRCRCHGIGFRSRNSANARQ